MFRINKRIILISIMLMIFLLMLSNIANAVAATQCEVDNIKQTLRKMLYWFYSNPNSAPFSATEVKDLLTFYLSINSNEITIDCSGLGSKSNKAILDIINYGKNVSDNIPKCTDGTQYGQCSGNRPKYCYAGAIYEKCGTCGCPINSFCGKSGKCETVSQNITCYNNIDCGTNKFVGNYYCSSDSIYKSLLNYTCVNPGTAYSICAAANGSVWLAYCNPSLNQICVNGQSTCQTRTADSAPTIAITVKPVSVAAGEIFNVTATGTDDKGLAAIWWWAVDSTDTELNKAHWFNCNSATYCSNSWSVSTSATGSIKLGANSRDTAYPIAGEAHQASEGAGIAYATITVSGAANASNVSGGLPDLIISDFKSYTGTTNTYVTISATIKNIGGSVTVGNLCDSLYVETLNARGFCGAKLNPGETRVIQSDYALPAAGTYKVRADTDYGRLVAESNENNNVEWQTITVTSPYSADYAKANTDLTVTGIDAQLPTTSSGSANIYVTTKNQGSLATGQYWVSTKVTNMDTGAANTVQRLAPIVQPGSTYSTYHGNVGIAAYGTYKVEAWVDMSNYIAESDENNNYMVKTVVYGNATTKQCSEGAIPSTGCLCQGLEKNSGYCCYSYLTNQLVWANVPCTQTCTSTGGVCCSGAASDCVGTWSGQWATDCQGYVCCIGTCTGTCYGPSCNQTTATTADSVSLYNLSVKDGNLIVGYSKNFVTCVHLLASNYKITHVQNYYCTQGNNIVITQPVSSFNVTAGQSYKLCHGNNYNICSELKALVNLTTAASNICTKSDKTDIYSTKGTVTDLTGATFEDICRWDECASSNNTEACRFTWGQYEKEYLCDSSGKATISGSYCEYGCSNGACLKTLTQGCSETDGGNKINVKGIATYQGRTYEDSCGKFTCSENYTCTLTDPNGINEYYCDATTGKLYKWTTTCPNGCLNGACVNQTATSNPDLTVDSMNFKPANPTNSDLIKINITVKNTGTATAGSSVLQVNYDPGWYTRLSIPSLASGAGYSWTLSWTLASNLYTFTATADKDGQVSEQNENNNALVKSLTVTGAINQTTNNTNQT